MFELYNGPFEEITEVIEHEAGKLIPLRVTSKKRLLKVSDNSSDEQFAFVEVAYCTFRVVFGSNTEDWVDWFSGFLTRERDSDQDSSRLCLMVNLASPALLNLRKWMYSTKAEIGEFGDLTCVIADVDSDLKPKDAVDIEYINLDRLIEYAQVHLEVMETIRPIVEAYVIFRRGMHESSPNMLPIQRLFDEEISSRIEWLRGISVDGRDLALSSVCKYDNDYQLSVYDLRGHADVEGRGDILIRDEICAILLKTKAEYRPRYYAADPIKNKEAFSRVGVWSNKFVPRVKVVDADLLPESVIKLLDQEDRPLLGVLEVELNVEERSIWMNVRDLLFYARFLFTGKGVDYGC